MKDKFIITGISRVIMVGKEEYTDNFLSFSHELKHCEIIFNFSGHSTVFFNDKVLNISPGSIRFLPKGRPSRYDVQSRERFECIDVFFDTDVPVSEEAFALNVSQNERIGVLFKRLFATWAGKSDGYYFESVSLLYRIFSELQKKSYSPKEHLRKISRGVDIIHSDFLRSDLSLTYLANACGMSESYFQRLFKEGFGVSPKKYIVQLKINHAAELLQLKRYTITEIAEMCNFSDVYFFSRQFKEYMGITPSGFIKKYISSK